MVDVDSLAVRKCRNNVMAYLTDGYAVYVAASSLGGFGLYAGEIIPTDGIIIEYIGEVIDDEEYSRRKALLEGQNSYFAHVGKQFIDASCAGNLSRFGNHSCKGFENCRMDKIGVSRKRKGLSDTVDLHVVLIATKVIHIGQEITYVYAPDFLDYMNKSCACPKHIQICA